jgi:shikimate 5-dehydrogenase
MKIALLGTGFGQAHAAIYAERDVEVVVFGRTQARLEDFQQKFGFSAEGDLGGLDGSLQVRCEDGRRGRVAIAFTELGGEASPLGREFASLLSCRDTELVVDGE